MHNAQATPTQTPRRKPRRITPPSPHAVEGHYDATAAQSLKETFGCDGQPNGVHDIEFCDQILDVGINTAKTHTVLWMPELDRLRGPDPPARS